jgi:hypothetical protein
MASTRIEAEYAQPKENTKTVKALERKKLDLLVKIGELQLELQKTNAELYRAGVRIESALCW